MPDRDDRAAGDDGAVEGWQPVRKVRAYEQVLSQIEERLRAGTLRPGDRLPGERQLSSLLGVSRGSVREALRVLEALEIVVARAGRGDDSGSVITREPGEALTSLLRFQIALSRFSMQDVIEARTMVERWAAQRAAERGTAEDHERMRATLEAMADRTLTPERFNELDTEFHVTVARAAHNDMIAYWMQAIRDAIRDEMAAAFAQLPDWRAVTDDLRVQHGAIYDAIRDGDGDLAAQLIARHITGFYASVGMAR